jgi:hypothetical protein
MMLAPETSATSAPAPAVHQFLKRNVTADDQVVPVTAADEADSFAGIRCPLCAWRPDAASRWCCDPGNSPEALFHGCLTVWNTFSTRGRCPGCLHQWRWTSCLRCSGWSLHDDWYEEEAR